MKTFYNLILLITMLCSSYSFAIDHIRYERGQSKLDTRGAYKKAVLKLALDHTIDTYGAYKITTEAPVMNSLQAIRQLKTGEKLNVFIAPTNAHNEKDTITIRLPVRKGLLNYRLLLIHKDDLPLFAKVKTIDDLKTLSAGLMYGWSTTTVMRNQGFKIQKGNHYDGLFKMLDARRFDFFPRGVNEIFDELEQRKDILKNVVIEPNLALYIPTPTYIFVSPKYPRLAKRLSEGFELMVQNGSFDKLFHQYFNENISKANLSERLILRLDNDYVVDRAPWERPELWFTP